MADLIVGPHEDRLRLDERITPISSAIDLIGKQYANCQRLMSIRGAGPTISNAMVAATGTSEVFDRRRHFAASIGLLPGQYPTGGKPILWRISKRGSKFVRTLLIRAVHPILMRPHN